jgi:hypothetical protein
VVERTENKPRVGVMGDPMQGGVAGWTVEEHLAFDIGFALPRAPIKGFRKALTEGERRVIAKSIVEHLKLCGWQFQMTAIDVGHGTRKLMTTCSGAIIARRKWSRGSEDEQHGPA